MVKFSVYLNRHVFLMVDPDQKPLCTVCLGLSVRILRVIMVGSCIPRAVDATALSKTPFRKERRAKKKKKKKKKKSIMVLRNR